MPAPASRRWLSRRLLVVAATALAALAARAQEAEKLTYDDHVRPVLENKCFSCHNPDKKKGGLDLTSYAALLAGGGGGAVVDAGNPAGSRLWTCSSKKEEPFMPPEGAPLEAKDLTLLSKWIAGGLLQAKGSVARKSSKPKVDLAFDAAAGKPTGPAARPVDVLLEPVVVTPRTTAITALAASPWTSLLAVASPKQVLLFDTDTRELAGILPYPEGYARSLKFSANGSLLILAGGRGGKFGHAVVWDVRTGRRVTEVGKEFDQVMSADITPDHRKIALATNTKKVKCYDTASGELLYTIAKHTEWVTGADFSPDGILLATSDRNGNVMVWEADNGGEFYNLGQHKGAVTDLAWRADSNVLASAGADGTISVWEMKTGKRVANWSAHGAVQSVAFTPDGRLLSCGNDGTSALWTIDGKRLPQAQAGKQGDVVSKVAALADGKTYVTGNWLGEVRFHEVETGRDLTQVPSNPPRIAQRIADAEHRLAELLALQSSPPAAAPTAAQLAAREAAAAAQARLAPLQAKIATGTKERDALRAAREKTTDVAARAELSKKMAALREQLAPSVAAADQERAFLRQHGFDLAWLTAELAELQARATDTEKTIDYWVKQQAKVKGAELEAATKALAAQRQALATLREQAATATARKDALAGEERLAAQLRSAGAEIAALRARIAALKAAEFNVTVLSERDRLGKLEAEIADALAAREENAKGREAAAAKLEPALREAERLAAAIPVEEAALSRLQTALAEQDKALTPLRLEEAAAAAKLEAQAKRAEEAAANLTEFLKRRDAEVAAAKAAIEDYARAMRPTRLRLADVTAQLEASAKQLKALQEAQASAERDLAAATASSVAAAAAVPTATQALAGARAASQEAERNLALAREQRENAASFRGYLTFRREAAIVEATSAVAAAATVRRRADEAVTTATAAVAAAQADIPRRAAAVVDCRRKLTELAAEAAKNEQGVGPLTKERDELTKTRAAQLKEYARLQGVPALVEKDLEAKSTPLRDRLKLAQEALKPLEAPLAEVRARLATALKPVEARRAEVAAATKQLAAARQAAATAAKTHAALVRELPERERALEELARSLETLQPQVEPLKAKVKAIEAQYLAMRPKQ
jgi:WD40 repeat protein